VKPYYQDDACTIYHADCREILPTLAADLILTDPPYNAGKDYGQHDDRMDPVIYRAWCSEWFQLCRAAGPRVIVFPGHGNLPMWFEIAPPSGIGCWYKPGNRASSHLGWNEWEPWLYWGQRLGGSDTFRVPFISNQAKDAGGHPCPKPALLFRHLLVKTKAATVLDPFMGSGTTLRAAKDLGRRAIGIEIEERYCEIAARRLGQEVLALG
jgi:DNA modification methylase